MPALKDTLDMWVGAAITGKRWEWFSTQTAAVLLYSRTAIMEVL